MKQYNYNSLTHPNIDLRVGIFIGTLMLLCHHDATSVVLHQLAQTPISRSEPYLCFRIVFGPIPLDTSYK